MTVSKILLQHVIDRRVHILFIWIGVFLPVTLAFNMSCPDLSQRAIRSEFLCIETSKQQYSCLFDEHNQTYNESCEDPDYVSFGQKYIISEIRRNTDCSSKRYQPFKFWSNTSHQCVFQKSKCIEIGQKIVDDKFTYKDTTCRCDFTKGFGFIKETRNSCSCIPSEEDCTCFAVSCPLNYTLTADYKCRPETSIADIPICSNVYHSRNDKENKKQDIKPVSNTILQNISTPVTRTTGIVVCTCLIAISIAYIVGSTIWCYWKCPKQTDQGSLNAIYREGIKFEMEKFEKELLDWRNDTKLVIGTLNDLTYKLDDNFLNINKAKIGGAAVAISGTLMGVAGLVTAPLTGGASLGMPAAALGGIVGGIGGATVGGSVIVDSVISKDFKQKALEILENYDKASKKIKRRCLELSVKLKKIGEVKNYFPEWVNFWYPIVHGKKESENATYNWEETLDVIEDSILNRKSAARILGEGVGTGIRIAGAAVRTTETSLHVASGIIGALMIPLDIHTLVTSAINVHKNNKHEISKMITEKSKAIENELPKEENIKRMIDRTLRRL